MSNCPFCGTDEFLPSAKTNRKVFECETEIEDGLPEFAFVFRGRDCLENQLAAQTALLRECQIALEDHEDHVRFNYPTLLPKLEEAVKEKVWVKLNYVTP